MGSIVNNVANALGDFDTATKVWKALKDRSGQVNPVEVMRLKTLLLGNHVKRNKKHQQCFDRLDEICN